MRKIFTLLFALLCASFLSQAFAQRKMYVWNNGNVKVVPTSSVDSVTFEIDNILHITTSSATNVTSNSFEAVGSVLLNDGVQALSVAPEVGVCYSVKHAQPTISDPTVQLSEGCGTKSISVSGLASGTTYYYCVYATLLGETYYGNICSVTTQGDKPVDKSKTINGHRFVDLGLPSGLLWAETNIGADNPEDAGNYYDWGETETKDTYTTDNSKWYGTEHSGNLTATEDAATVNWGSGVRMPTEEEFSEIIYYNYCTWTWTSKNGMDGYQVNSNSNGNEIFLPAAGYRYGSELYGYREDGAYWTSTPDLNGDVYYAWFLHISYNNHYMSAYFPAVGYTVRAVAE